MDWNALGNRLQTELNQPDEAERAYRQAIAVNPHDPRPWNGLGILLAERFGRTEEAARAFRAAIALDAGFAAPWNGLGIYQQDQLCRPDLAELSFLRAIELDRFDATPWCNLAGLLRTWKSDLAGAERACRIGLDLAPDEPFLWLCRGGLALIRGQRVLAHAWLTQALTLLASHNDPQARVVALSLAIALDQPMNPEPVIEIAAGTARPVEAALVLTICAIGTDDLGSAARWRQVALTTISRHDQRAWAVAECATIAGLRPTLRAQLAPLARDVFALGWQNHRTLDGTPTPELVLRRYRRFAFHGGEGLGDALDRPLWCRDAASAWSDLETRAVKATRH